MRSLLFAPSAGILALFLLLSAPLSAYSQDTISAFQGSRHWISGDYNEVNPGLMLAWDAKSGEFGLSYVTGAYYNSFSRLSVLNGVKLGWRPSKYVRLGASVGAVTGYSGPKDAFGLTPMASPSVALGNPAGAEIHVLPGAFGFSLFYRPGG